MSKGQTKPKLKYNLPSEKSARSFARHVFDELDEDENVKTRQENINGLSDFLVTVATVIAKSKAND